MQITIREASELLNISENVLYRLVDKKEIPAYKIKTSYLFNRIELLEWALSNPKHVSPKVLAALSQPLLHFPSVAEALQRGGIYYEVPGERKEAVLREIVNRIPITVSPNITTEEIFSALIERETLGSTGIGNGIAIPHVRNPIVLDVEEPLIVLCFLKTPIDFNAIDHKPVDTFFTLISTTVRSHLHLLARLSFLLQSSRVQEALKNRLQAEQLLAIMSTIEDPLNSAGRSKKT